ncbi:MAG: hypothetical protein VX430_01065 [Pseudomonadota bacterium]|nr:hypothetical protein [Pseudomonadota bacterium]
MLTAAFDLLRLERGPIIEDYPEDVPEGTSDFREENMMGMVCPIDLPKLTNVDTAAGELGRALVKEIDSLSPWYDLAVRTRGRTTVGPSGLDLKVCAKFFAEFIENQEVLAPRNDLLKGRVLKLAYEDLKAYYGEAITAQPGYVSSLQVENWLFNDTVFGKMLWTLRSICRESDNEYYQYLGGNSIVPDRQVELSERASQVLE